MKRFFNEDINLAPPDRQVAGIGPGSRVDGMYNKNVPKEGERADSEPTKAPVKLPFEIETVVGQISDMYVKLVNMKNSFESACENVSVNEAKQVPLKKACARILKINRILISIPILLDDLSV